MKPLDTCRKCLIILLSALATFCFSRNLSAEIQQVNLVPDGSFESDWYLWLPEDQKSYYIAKERSASAADGRNVLAIKAWHKRNAKILSPVIPVPPGPVSVSCQVRHFGDPGKVTFELAVFDKDGRKVIEKVATWQGDGSGRWHTLKKEKIRAGDVLSGLLGELDEGDQSGVGETKLKGDNLIDELDKKLAKTGYTRKGIRLGLIIHGPEHGQRIEIDNLGLFVGEKAGTVKNNNVDIQILPGMFKKLNGWRVEECETYIDGPKDNILATTKEGTGNHVAQTSVNVPIAGRYRLLVRFRFPKEQARKFFSVGIKQKKLNVKKTFENIRYSRKKEVGWAWGNVDIELDKGPVEISLSLPKNAIKRGAFRVSRVLLTHNPDYDPMDNDLFTTPAYMRFANESEGQDPFMIYVYVHTHDTKAPHNHKALLGRSGVMGFFPPADKTMLIGKGDTTPWLCLSDVLYADQWTHLNSLTLTATRKGRLSGWVAGRLKGQLEFAIGTDRKIIKTVEIDQNCPTIDITLPYDFKRHPQEIMAPIDYVNQKKELIAKWTSSPVKAAKHLQIIANCPSFASTPRKVVEGELSVFKALAINTINKAPKSKEAVDFYRRNNFDTRFTLDIHSIWEMIIEQSMYQPDIREITEKFAKLADQYKETKEDIYRVILADEPGGMSYETLKASYKNLLKFREYLKSRGIMDDLDAVEDDLDEKDKFQFFDPSKDKRRKYDQPKLFYNMEIFRLKGMAHLLKGITRIKNQYLPKHAYTLINHVPYHSGYGSWVKRGVDPFFCHRDGAAELPWTEDWMAYGAGTQEMSPQYAILRAAGKGNGSRLGGYVVVKDGSSEIVRKKLYTALAGGMREIVLYNYSPPYAGWLNSWSEQFEKYPVLRQTFEEFGRIDDALHQASRAPTDIALLYNRTQAIWANPGYTSYYDTDLYHWALAHAGYDADYVSEEDIESGILDKYKVLYISGEHVKKSCANAIAGWVEKGGVLFGATGGGQRDEFSRPMTTLTKAFGAKGNGLKDTGVRMPRSGMKKMEANDQVTSNGNSNAPKASYANFSFWETLEPDTAKVFLKGSKGQPAGTINASGKGKAVRIAGAPGVSYLCHAVQDENYDVKSYLPKKFNRQLRDLIAWPAKLANARKVVETDQPIMEVARYEKPGSTVLIIIDHDAIKKDKVTLRVPRMRSAKSARTATGKPVTMTVKNDEAVLSLPINGCEAVVIDGATD